jgi:flagellar basal body-associated protein FliL
MDMTAPTIKTWILIFVFITTSAVSSVVAGSYSSESACKDAANAAEMQPRASGLDITTLCVLGE